MNKFVILIFLLNFKLVLASNDEKLAFYIEQFKFKAVPKLAIDQPSFYKLGEKLFFDKRISLKNNISCSTCHHPDMSTGDALPFSIGERGVGLGILRQQMNAGITNRNSPNLLNKGHMDFTDMFWDGRVRYSPANDTYRTPELALNGREPELKEIKEALGKSALAAQALFPMVNVLEMRGEENAHLTNLEVWEMIVNKIQTASDYEDPLKENFGDNWKNINIGHLANAIAYYEARAFQITNTPWDQYLRGDLTALSEKEKRGAIVFSDKARCANCHHGTFLTNFAFQNIGIPPMAPHGSSEASDLGHFKVMPMEHFKYAFLTPPLRQIAKTAPYFHNGSFLNLKDVITHYLNPIKSIESFDANGINEIFKFNFNQPFIIESNPEIKKEIQNNLHPLVRNPVDLTLEEQEDLLHFLEVSLTEK